MPAAHLDKDDLIHILSQEVDFYRALHLLIERQREWLTSESNVRICDVFSEIDRIKSRIEQSERSLSEARLSAPEEFTAWVRTPEAQTRLDRIAQSIVAAQEIVTECIAQARTKRARYQRGLNQMGHGRRLLAMLAPQEDGPLYLDARP